MYKISCLSLLSLLPALLLFVLSNPPISSASDVSWLKHDPLDQDCQYTISPSSPFLCPIAFGHYVNHLPTISPSNNNIPDDDKDRNDNNSTSNKKDNNNSNISKHPLQPNILYTEFHFPLEFPSHLRGFIPHVYFSGSNSNSSSTIIRSVALVTLRDVANEELFADYCYIAPQKKKNDNNNLPLV